VQEFAGTHLRHNPDPSEPQTFTLTHQECIPVVTPISQAGERVRWSLQACRSHTHSHANTHRGPCECACTGDQGNFAPTQNNTSHCPYSEIPWAFSGGKWEPLSWGHPSLCRGKQETFVIKGHPHACGWVCTSMHTHTHTHTHTHMPPSGPWRGCWEGSATVSALHLGCCKAPTAEQWQPPAHPSA
jgi:hypothetical protein